MDRVEFVGVGDVNLIGDRWGPADGPLVLMLHGGGQTRHSWKETGARLGERGLTVVTLDARGHGDSDWAPDGDYAPATLAQDVLMVLESLGRPAVVVGASMGGFSALLASTKAAADQLAALVLVDVVPRFEHAGAERIIAFATGNPDGFATLDEASDAIAAYLPHRRRPSNNDGLQRNLRQRADGRWYWHWDPRVMMQGRIADVEYLIEDLEDAARGLSVPTLLVRGLLSDVVSERGAEDFLALVPHAQLVELHAAAHTAAADDNDAFTEALLDFVTVHARP